MLELAVTILIQVTAPDGAKVFINPQYITKLYPTKEALEKGFNQMVVKGAKCVITMSDGKFLSVLETCDHVLGMAEGRLPRKQR